MNICSTRSIAWAVSVALVVLQLAYSAHAVTTASSTPRPSQTGNDEDTDDDGEDGPVTHTRTRGQSTPSRSDDATPSVTSSTSSSPVGVVNDTHQSGLSGGAIAGIVIGILIVSGLVALLLFYWCGWGYRRKPLAREEAGGVDTSLINSKLLPADASQAERPLPSLPVSGPRSLHDEHAPSGTPLTGGHTLSASQSTLPNPFDSSFIPISFSGTEQTAREAGLLPTSEQLRASRPQSDATSFNNLASSSGALEAIGGRLSIVSSAHSHGALPVGSEGARMAEYQKRLEIHHHKESFDTWNGVPPVPAEPPPRYSVNEEVGEGSEVIPGTVETRGAEESRERTLD
ncbi:hypothetical protein K474DRAFT_1768102 [Panus rudis PR-1116 ss-1]|nr:hypothetical protein K474DRAFT_1768102 [Panus rudis PR-1116 ss-1]